MVVVEVRVDGVFDFIVYVFYSFVEDGGYERYVIFVVCVSFCVRFDFFDGFVGIVFDSVDNICFGDIVVIVNLGVIVEIIIIVSIFFFGIKDKL